MPRISTRTPSALTCALLCEPGGAGEVWLRTPLLRSARAGIWNVSAASAPGGLQPQAAMRERRKERQERTQYKFLNHNEDHNRSSLPAGFLGSRGCARAR